ncbi:MAG: TonB-dependent receptor plug domain-containing protein [Opitutaceae bacterium]
MNHPFSRGRAFALTSALCLVTGARLAAQVIPATAPKEEEKPVVLSPFVVDSSEDTGYSAKDTIAGTRIRTELKDVGSAISVITAKFLQDTNSRSAEELLVYTTGTEVAGQGGNFLGQGDGAVLTGTNRTSPISNTRVRGLAEADNTRDFFLSDIPWDSYNVGRVDLQRGANSILFGIGSPAGIVNSSLNTAAFKDSNKVEYQFGTFGTQRASADFNKVLIPQELAVRLSLLRNDTKYRQDPAFKDDHRFFAALKWDPKFISAPGSHTSFRANFEKGKIRSNNPRGTPPLDAITPWFALSKPTLDSRTASDSVSGNPGFSNWLGAPGGRVFDGVVTAFDGGSQGLSYPSQVTAYPNPGGGTNGSGIGNNTLRGIRTYNEYGNAAFPAGAIGAYKAKSVTDSKIFDFYNNLLEGPNKREYNDFNAVNLSLAQTFLNDKVGIELAYDRQKAKFGYANFLSGDGAVITVDMMSTLADGRANPNVGRPMTISGGGSAGLFWRDRVREAKRVTAFGELNFNDIMGRENNLGKILGRHVVTGLYNTQRNDTNERSGPRFFLSEEYGAVKRGDGANPDSLGQASRDDIFYNYLGGSVAGFSSASGIGLTGIKNVVTPQNSSINVWNNVANQWQAIPLIIKNNDLQSDDAKQYTQGVKSRSTVDSSAVVWQAYLFSGNLVPMIGVRRDEEIFQSAGSPVSIRGVAQVQDPTWRLPNSASDVNNGTNLDQRKWNKVTGNSKTWSVVGHVPRSIMEKVPGGLGLSAFYNQSENFQPDAGRRDIFGNTVTSPSGKTKDYGITITALNDKLTLRINRYETSVANANVAGEIGGQYLIGAVEGWGQQAAVKFRSSVAAGGTLSWPADTRFGISSSGNQVTWKPAGPTQGSSPDPTVPGSGYTYSQAVLDATYTREKASIDAWFATQVPSNLQQMWGLKDYATGGGSINFAPSGLTVTGDTVSKGTEFELTANPIKGLDISANASKTSAKRMNLAKSYTTWILKRQAEFAGPAGDMRLWGADDDFSADSAHGGETARGKFQRETISGYNLWQALQNSDVPELRPWRFNMVANYTFQSEGVLRGVNIGSSYRWQDKNVTGFPVVTRNGVLAFDVNNPYHGPTEGITDAWIGYERKLTAKVRWRAQLNVRDLFSTNKLIRVTVQPDGSPGSYRIPEPRTITLTNSFTF